MLEVNVNDEYLDNREHDRESTKGLLEMINICNIIRTNCVKFYEWCLIESIIIAAILTFHALESKCQKINSFKINK